MDESGQILYKVLSSLGGADGDLQKADDSTVPLSQLCRICALPNEYLIPIFEGEGQENNLADRIHSHLPIRVNNLDDYPDHVCYQCASTLLAFHDLVDCCTQADITLSARVQLGQSKKTFTKELNQSKQDVTQSNKERYVLPFRSYRQTQRVPLRAPPNPPIDGVKFQLVSEVETKFMNDDLFPLEDCHSDDGDDNNEIVPFEIDNKTKCDEKNQYLILQSIIDKLQVHVTKFHKFPNQGTASSSEDDEDNKPLSLFVSGARDAEDNNEFGSQSWDTSSFPCTRCRFVGRDKADLESHTQKAHGDLPHLFKRSSRRLYDTQTKLELNNARVKVDGKVLYQCEVCDRYLTSAYSYVTHKTIHSGQKLFPCEICGRKFRLLGFLKNHMRHIHSVRNKQDLAELKNPSIQNFDSFCVVRKNERNYLDYRAIEKAKVTIDGVTYYQCELCGKKLTRLNYYVSHRSIHTGEKKFICHLCGKRFRLASMLQVHLKLTHQRIKSHACDVCHQKFGTSTNLLEHRRTHTGERPYACSLCGKRFKQRSALFVHSRTHSDHFPFSCTHCDSKFKIQSLLNYHMVKHTGETPFPCHQCDKSFAFKSILNQHMRIHSDSRPYCCIQCDKTFRHKKNLKVHLKNCHKI